MRTMVGERIMADGNNLDSVRRCFSACRSCVSWSATTTWTLPGGASQPAVVSLRGDAVIYHVPVAVLLNLRAACGAGQSANNGQEHGDGKTWSSEQNVSTRPGKRH